jgi:hypothetical protein
MLGTEHIERMGIIGPGLAGIHASSHVDGQKDRIRLDDFKTARD